MRRWVTPTAAADKYENLIASIVIDPRFEVSYWHFAALAAPQYFGRFRARADIDQLVLTNLN
jgi:hypothetical protein